MANRYQRTPRAFRNEPEWMRTFRENWLAMLWTVMQKTGNGYPRPKADKGYPGGRRPDKLVTIPADPSRFEPRKRRNKEVI